jgi:D-threo-aldose 1-dehydrogenase
MKKNLFKAPSGASLSLTEMGMGTAPLGNLYRPLSEKDAQDTLEAAWKAGIRYFVLPHGLGIRKTNSIHFSRSQAAICGFAKVDAPVYKP